MRYDSYCGLYCGACEVLLLGEKGLLEEKAGEWKRKPEDLRCQGCKSDVISVYCRNCDIKMCAEGRGVEYCFECPDFPCPVLKEFRNDEYAHHSVVFHNLNLIREQGLESWLKAQEKRWSCPECGEKFSWYDKKCSRCGARIINCRDEEKDLHIRIKN